MKKQIGVILLLLIITLWTTFSQEAEKTTAVPTENNNTTEDNYAPLTSEEAEKWLQSITLEELINWVILWDFIEHSRPTLNINYITLLTDTDVLMVPKPENTDLIVGSGEKAFTYKIRLPTFTFKGILKPPIENRFGLGLGIGIGSGLIVGGLIGLLFNSNG